MAELILFEHVNFEGAHRHFFTSDNDLGSFWDIHTQQPFNDITSSFVVLSGKWQFSRDADYGGPDSNIFGPGIYNNVEEVGIQNDSISSVALI
jgi:hypothetical protein